MAKDRFSESEFKSFRKKIESNYQYNYAELYRMKVKDPSHWGPYATLIKAVGFRSSEMWCHDYFKAPEIVEDICFCFEKKYGLKLLDIFKENTRPCIVKFIQDDSKKSYIGIALYYLHTLYFDKSFSLDFDICFDGKGKAVKKEFISKVNFL